MMTVRQFIELLQANPRVLDLAIGDRFFEPESGWMYMDARQVFIYEDRVHVSCGGVPIGTPPENVLTWGQ